MAWFILDPVLYKRKYARQDGLVFYSRRDRSYCRRYVIPRNPDTALQRANRSRFSEAVHAWQALSASEKDEWKRKARITPCNGYNLFLPVYIKTKINTVELRCTSEEGSAVFNHVVIEKSSCSRIHSVPAPVKFRFRSYGASMKVKSPPEAVRKNKRHAIRHEHAQRCLQQDQN